MRRLIRACLVCEIHKGPVHTIASDKALFHVPGSNSGDILFLPCLFVGLFVGWTTLTLVLTFELFEIEPLYLACRFLVTRASHSYKKFDL